MIRRLDICRFECSFQELGAGKGGERERGDGKGGATRRVLSSRHSAHALQFPFELTSSAPPFFPFSPTLPRKLV